MKIWARKNVSAEFTNEELEILINASLTGAGFDEAVKLLVDKYGGEGYMSGEEIALQAYEYDEEKYKGATGFQDIDWA